jgi:hypothetical protein
VARTNGSLKERLGCYDQDHRDLQATREHDSIPVWFVLEYEALYLLPVQGSETQWYKDVLKNPTIRIDARGVEAEFSAKPVTDAEAVKSVVEKFGAKDVKKCYAKFDVAVLVEVG